MRACFDMSGGEYFPHNVVESPCLKIGDYVKIIRKNGIFSMYGTFAKKYYLKKWKVCRQPDLNKIYKLTMLEQHLRSPDILAVIEDFASGNQFIFNSNAIIKAKESEKSNYLLLEDELFEFTV